MFFEDLKIGDSAETAHTVTEADLIAFAQVSGDTNPVHLDADYAAATPFGERIAHGMLAAAYISAVMGTKLPGPGVVYLTQSLKFRRPVKIGDAVVARVTVEALDARRGWATLKTVCEVGGKAVLDGEAMVVVPKAPPSKDLA
jgi:3-hydroxybutyryl-CoA dehydratase